ncbi:glycosyltransferase family 4 protein [Intrasporangium chromatireducens]|uniref:glycosyltransferase family 4 protein n=1 Tax=Intrasporangium chromatireducens TaxID=1386088 RepID=UPI000686A60D|nr:glycosyltransferase family 4 protein [Intrasporangium chromatireducens]
MKVLYSFPHPIGAPGIGLTAWHQVDALARAGVDVTVVCTSVRKRFDAELPVHTLSLLGPVRPRMVGLNRTYSLHDWVVSQLIRSLKPDLVHLWPRAVLKSAAMARLMGLVSVREAPSPYTRLAVQQARAAWAEIGLPVPQGHFHDLGEEQLTLEDAEFAAVDFVIVGSEQAAASFGVAPFPVQVRVNEYGYDDRVQQSRRRTIGGLSRDFVFIGRLEPTKGVHQLLECWAAASPPEGAGLVLYGDIDASTLKRLGPLLSHDHVRLGGYCNNVESVLDSADVLVLPSRSEGSALVGYEALGRGVIPLVSDASGCPVVHGVSGLVHHAGDSAQLTGHLKAVLADTSLVSRLRHGGREERGKWTWEASGRRLAALYDDLLNAPRRVPAQGAS